MKNKNINSEWENFKTKIIPRNASKVQIQEMRRAFYAGAASTFHLITNLGDKDLTEEQSVEELNKIQRELEAFFSKVGKEF